MRKVPLITFVDIDAVPVPALEARPGLAVLLERLARERISLIFCTQQTRAQIESARQAFGVFHPFICEAGSALFIPERYFGSDLENARAVGGYQAVAFGEPHDAVAATLHRVSERQNARIVGFNDMSVEQVARELGLSLLDARLAMLREYSEPFRLLNDNPITERRLFRALEGSGLTCRRGTDFHLATSAAGPQAAIPLLTTLYRAAFGSVLTAATLEGIGAAELVPHVDLPLDPIVLDRDDRDAGLTWLERIVQEADTARTSHQSARVARMAR
jgi:predicted mannosyl-3-phosphoglycerate phosphatase (HAD superfamily)